MSAVTSLQDTPERPVGQWPGWVDDVLAFGPISELEAEWRAAIGDAITRVLDRRAGRFKTYRCDSCGRFLTRRIGG